MRSPRITQGAYRLIRAFNTVDANDEPLVVTGWAVRAMARCHHADGALLAEWSSTPTGNQGQATAQGREVVLVIKPAMSSAWDCDRVNIQAEITNPLNTDQVERIINQTYDLDREGVR